MGVKGGGGSQGSQRPSPLHRLPDQGLVSQVDAVKDADGKDDIAFLVAVGPPLYDAHGHLTPPRPAPRGAARRAGSGPGGASAALPSAAGLTAAGGRPASPR